MLFDDPQSEGLRVIRDLVRRHGEDLSDSDLELLSTRAERHDEIDDTTAERLTELTAFALSGFFRAASEGEEFLDRGVVLKRFGRTVASNYPEAGPSFLRFANCYWTFKLLTDEVRQADRFTALSALMTRVEGEVGPVFFPTPGPITIDPAKREATQRALLEALAPGIDVEEFIAHNPILRRDRVSGSSGVGCLWLPIALFGAPALYWMLPRPW